VIVVVDLRARNEIVSPGVQTICPENGQAIIATAKFPDRQSAGHTRQDGPTMPPGAAPHHDAQRAASPRALYPMRIPSTEKQVYRLLKISSILSLAELIHPGACNR
jgi:hypothetical protein